MIDLMVTMRCGRVRFETISANSQIGAVALMVGAFWKGSDLVVASVEIVGYRP